MIENWDADEHVDRATVSDETDFHSDALTTKPASEVDKATPEVDKPVETPTLDKPTADSQCPICGSTGTSPAFGFYKECSRCESIYDSTANRTHAKQLGGYLTETEEAANLTADLLAITDSALTVLGPFRDNRTLEQLERINPAQKAYPTSMGIALAAVNAGFNVTHEYYALELLK